MKICYLLLLIPLSGCFEEMEKKLQTREAKCFQMAPHKEYLNPIMINECTGESWMLVSTPLSFDKDGKVDTNTYRWFPILKEYREAELENRFKR